MKRILSIIFAMLAISACTTYAATDLSRSIGVVVIGGAEYKTPEFYKIIEKGLNPKSNAKIIIGNDVQNKYQKYLFNNDLSVNELPSKRTLVNFVAASGYGKILFIEISNTNIDHQNNAKSRQKDRITIQVDSYLCDNLNVLEVATTSQDFNSKTSDLRARRGAFKKCLEDISKNLNRAM